VNLASNAWARGCSLQVRGCAPAPTMVRIQGLALEESEFQGRKAAQTFKRQTHCCNDSLFAVAFVLNLLCMGWLATFTWAEEEVMDKISSIGPFDNATLRPFDNATLLGFELEDTVWEDLTVWVENQLALVQRDVRNNFDLVAMAGVVGICTGVIWLQLLQRFTSFVVHVTMLLVVVMTTALGFLLFKYADNCLVKVQSMDVHECVSLQKLSQTESDILRVVSYVLWAVAAMILVAICVLRTKIALTVTIFEEAASSCLTNLGIYPVTMLVLLLVLAVHAAWASTAVFLFGKPGDAVVDISFVQEHHMPVRLLLLYLAFSYFWVIAFLRALFRASVAGIVGNWYFNRHHAAAGSPLLSWWRPLWANLTVSGGSLALGALCVGVCSFLRYVLGKVERWSKANPALATVFKCCKCCLWCVETCFTFVSQYAYVYVAMERCTFCSGAKKSFDLISQYPIQLVVMKAINSFVLLCGKLLLTSTMLIFFFLMLERLERDFCGLFIVLVGIGLLQVFRLQANVIEAAADTVFVCYVMDLNLNDGEAVHLKNSTANLHQKVQSAVAQYERDYPHEIGLQKMSDKSSDDVDIPITSPRP